MLGQQLEGIPFTSAPATSVSGYVDGESMGEAFVAAGGEGALKQEKFNLLL